MMLKSITTVFAVGAMLASCATLRDSLIVGGTAGAAAGALYSNQTSRKHDPQSTAVGAITGAAIGSLFGYLGHKENMRKEKERQDQLNALQGKPQYPSVTTPQVRAIWVPDKIENEQFVSGHYIYVIDKPATFRKE